MCSVRLSVVNRQWIHNNLETYSHELKLQFKMERTVSVLGLELGISTAPNRTASKNDDARIFFCLRTGQKCVYLFMVIILLSRHSCCWSCLIEEEEEEEEEEQVNRRLSEEQSKAEPSHELGLTLNMPMLFFSPFKNEKRMS